MAVFLNSDSGKNPHQLTWGGYSGGGCQCRGGRSCGTCCTLHSKYGWNVTHVPNAPSCIHLNATLKNKNNGVFFFS